MNKFSKAMIGAALATVSVSVGAWGWSPNGWADDGFGNTANAVAQDDVRAHYYDYYAPYWAYSPGVYPSYGAQPFAPTPEQQKALSEQQKAFAEQQKAFAEQQSKALQQAVEAQRKLAEQYAASYPQLAAPAYADVYDPMLRVREMERQLMEQAATDERRFLDTVRDDLARPAPTLPSSAASHEEWVKQMQAEREKSMKEMQAEREKSMKAMEARRAEILKRIEAQRQAIQKGSTATL